MLDVCEYFSSQLPWRIPQPRREVVDEKEPLDVFHGKIVHEKMHDENSKLLLWRRELSQTAARRETRVSESNGTATLGHFVTHIKTVVSSTGIIQ